MGLSAAAAGLQSALPSSSAIKTTANLDAKNARDIITALAAAATRQRTVAVASHDRALIDSAQRVIALEHGRLHTSA